MVERSLVIDYTKCTGCRICEGVCSIRRSKEFNPEKSAIRIVKIDELSSVTSLPVKCLQCENPPCLNVCPRSAISTNPNTGARVIDPNRCIGCSSCIYACPFGAMVFDRSQKTPFVCDLCDGDPLCAQLCPFGALKYVRNDEAGISLKRSRVDRLKEAIKTGAAA